MRAFTYFPSEVYAQISIGTRKTAPDFHPPEYCRTKDWIPLSPCRIRLWRGCQMQYLAAFRTDSRQFF